VNATPTLLTLLLPWAGVGGADVDTGSFIAIGLANLISFAFVARKLLRRSMVRISWKYQEP